MIESVFYRYECTVCGKIICRTIKQENFRCPDCKDSILQERFQVYKKFILEFKKIFIKNNVFIGKRFKAVETELSYLIKRFENIEKRIDGLEADIIRFVQEEKAKIIAYVKEKIND